MPYLNVDVYYFEHRKTVRLESMIGDGASVWPLKLWAHCAKYHAKDGVLSGYTGLELERSIGWRGAPGRLIRALKRSKFVEKCPKGFKVYKWINHEGHLSFFHERAKTAAARRWGTMPESPSSIASSIAQKDSSNPPTIPTIPNQPNPTNQTNGEHVFDFEEVWLRYPNKDGKKAAEKAFKASVKTEQDWLDLQKAIANYLESAKVKAGFIKNGSTWFANWRDWISFTGTGGANANGAHSGSNVRFVSKDPARRDAYAD